MNDLTTIIQLIMQVGATPSNSGQPLASKDIDFNQTFKNANTAELSSSKFVLAPGEVDVNLCFGTISLAKTFFILPEAAVSIKITNSAGTSQDLVLVPNVPSLFNMEATGVSVTNLDAALPVKGSFFVLGD